MLYIFTLIMPHKAKIYKYYNVTWSIWNIIIYNKLSIIYNKLSIPYAL